jgi:hypothetical protein
LWNCLILCTCVLNTEINIWDKFEIEIEFFKFLKKIVFKKVIKEFLKSKKS